jgi:hypothetical protein
VGAVATIAAEETTELEPMMPLHLEKPTALDKQKLKQQQERAAKIADRKEDTYATPTMTVLEKQKIKKAAEMREGTGIGAKPNMLKLKKIEKQEAKQARKDAQERGQQAAAYMAASSQSGWIDTGNAVEL